MIKLLLILLLPLIFVGCGEVDNTPSETNTKITDVATIINDPLLKVYKYEDKDAQVTCWIQRGSGISCLPNKDLRKE